MKRKSIKNRNCTVLALALLALAVTASQTPAQSIYTPYAFTNFAGLPGVGGSDDGAGSAARFNGPLALTGSAGQGGIAVRFRIPSGLAVDSGDNVYVADTYNHTI